MKKRILVLCVDRDDDLGKKANVTSPVVGEQANLDAAQALALADPSESDVNAIYQAVSTYRELKSDGEDVEVVTIAGHRTRGSRADREIVRQLDSILEAGKFTSLALISDGADDEQIMPLIQSRIKVEFVKTVIVKQTKELEKSYYVIKEILKDPYFARIIFGIPGLLVLIWAITWFVGMEQDALKITLAVVGAYMFFRGFGIEDMITKAFTAFKKTTSVERASFPLYIASLIVLLLSLWAGYDYNITSVMKNAPEEILQDTAGMAIVLGAGFLQGFISLFTLAVIFFLAGRIGDMYYRKEVHKIKRYARSIVSMIALALTVYVGSEFVLFLNDVLSVGPSLIDLVVWVVFSIVFTFAGFSLVKYIYVKRYVQPRLKKGMDVRDLKNRKIGAIEQIDYKNRRFYYLQGNNRKSTNFGKVTRIRDAVIVHL